MQNIDHLVYVVPNLEEGMEMITTQFGVSPVYGGRHLDQGTHNAILRLGERCYFEIIAIDPVNTTVGPPRWMGVDLIDQPSLARWALAPVDWSRDVQRIRKINPKLGHTTIGRRQQANGQKLEWEMTLPQDAPAVEVIPFLLNWKGSSHPAESLSAFCTLKALRIEHPDPDKIRSLLRALEAPVTVKAARSSGIIAVMDTPNGEVTIR